LTASPLCRPRHHYSPLSVVSYTVRFRRHRSFPTRRSSDLAVEPLEASTTGRPGRIHPLHRAWRNRERASRCLSDPVGWLDSSLRWRSTHQSLGSGTCSRWVSEVLLAADCTALTASISQRRDALS